MFTATLAGKREESTLLPSSSSEAAAASLLLITTPFSLSSFSSPISHFTTMASKTPQLSFQKLPKSHPTIPNTNDSNPITTNEVNSNVYSLTSSPSSIPHRRLPLPTKLSFEQNLTNLIEKESPLLQSELLTAEHELSVLRSRLAVNEGVTAVSGSILQSLKEQFHPKQQQQSSAIQTSPSLDSLPDSLEIHYDEQSPRRPYLLVKAKNSYWLAQPLHESEVRDRFETFSSPMMKRARIRFPEDFPIEDIDQDSISDDDQLVSITRDDQLSEMKTIRSSSLLQQIDQFERFDDKLDEIYSSIDALKHSPHTEQRTLNHLQDKFHQLKFIMHHMHFTKEDELRLEYEFDELENLFHHTNKHEDYNLLELFEQNLNELQHIIEEIKRNEAPRDFIAEFQTKLESIEKKSYPRLIPENPIVTKEVFFEGEKIFQRKKPAPRLIPEDPQINAASFYEGDIRRSFYAHPPPEPEKKILIPENPLVSSDVFYEGDPQRSMFNQRINSVTSPLAIENLREIMSDLMLAASWSKKPSRLDRQSTKESVDIHAESFLTMEEQQQSQTPVCEIIHEIEDFSIVNPPIFIDENEYLPLDIIIDDDNRMYYQVAVQIVNDVMENILLTHDDDFNSIASSMTSEIDEEEQSRGFSSVDTDEENEQLIPQISDQPYLFVTDVVTSRSTQELGNLVQELQVLEHHFHDIHPPSSSSSDDEEISSSNLLIPRISTTKSVTELTNLVSELQDIEDELADKLQSPDETITSPVSSKSFNELGGLINELKSVTNRIHQEIFMTNNIDCLSQDLVKHRRESLLEEQSDAIDQLIEQVIQEAQDILLAEVNLSLTFIMNLSLSCFQSSSINRPIPKIIVDYRRTPCHQSSATSISDDLDLSHGDTTMDRTLELEDQLDYLRRMSRYENLLEEYDRSQQIYQHSMEKTPTDGNKSLTTVQNHPGQHFQSAYDLHDEEKSKLVRSPELYNIDNVAKHDHRSLLTNTQIQHRTLSESALTTDDCKRHSMTTSNDTSVEFLTTTSIDNSLEYLPLTERLPTPFADVLEKESSPEHSESSQLPTSAFSDTLEPTSSSQRPLIISTLKISDNAYQTAASDLVNQILTDVINEFHDDNHQSTSSDQSDNLSDDQTSSIPQRSKILRRAQTDTKHFDIIQSPIALIPPIIRRNSQSDTETYFRAVSPAIHEYTQIEHSSSDENCSPKKKYLFPREHEKYSGEGEESSGGKERIIQRRKRSSDMTNAFESPAMKTIPFKFDNPDTYFHRQESLDSPLIDSNEKSLFKHLQETILRKNLESFQVDLQYRSRDIREMEKKDYSSTKKSLSNDDYDGGSENEERDQSKTIICNPKSIEMNIRNLLDELLDTIHDNLSLSSHSDATTVILNSKKNSLDHEESLHPQSISSSSSSHSVIIEQEYLPSYRNRQAQAIISSYSNPDLIDSSIEYHVQSSLSLPIP